MVLHDNKWDKKAKQAYNRKHGIVTPKPVAKIVPKDHWKYESDEEIERPGATEGTDAGESDADESGTEDAGSSGLQAMELPALPDMAEQSAEEKALIARHIAQQAATKKNYRSHVTVTSDASEFEKINSNVEHTRLARDVRRRFGKASPAELEEDDDFDAFMDNPVPSAPSRPRVEPAAVSLDKEKQAFIDSLLR